MKYKTAPEVAAVAEDLIFDYHEFLGSHGPVMDWVFVRSTTSTEPRMFKIQKVAGVGAFLAAEHRPENFHTEPQAPERVAVLVGHFQWEMMADAERKGLVDHVLHHLRYDSDKESWRIEPPEYGEFPEVLERHGFWRPDDSFREFAGVVAEQLSLLPEEDEEDQERENLAVTITHNGRTVETDTDTMRGLAEGPNGERVDAETGEILEGSIHA